LSIIPYVEGYVLREFSFEADFGGRDVTREFQRVASERYPLHDDRYVPILRKWKEAYSFCRTTRETAGGGVSGETVTAPVVGGFAATLETGLQVEFRHETWKACETLFTAQLFRSFGVVGMQGAIRRVINQCPIDQRSRLYSGIELMGGTTKFDGLAERLEKELRGKTEVEGHVAQVRVSAKRNRQYASWMGGAGLSELAANGGHDIGWLTIEDVEEEGYDRLLGPEGSDAEGDSDSSAGYSGPL
jgi:actin-related protein